MNSNDDDDDQFAERRARITAMLIEGPRFSDDDNDAYDEEEDRYIFTKVSALAQAILRIMFPTPAAKAFDLLEKEGRCRIDALCLHQSFPAFENPEVHMEVYGDGSGDSDDEGGGGWVSAVIALGYNGSRYVLRDRGIEFSPAPAVVDTGAQTLGEILPHLPEELGDLRVQYRGEEGFAFKHPLVVPTEDVQLGRVISDDELQRRLESASSFMIYPLAAALLRSFPLDYQVMIAEFADKHRSRAEPLVTIESQYEYSFHLPLASDPAGALDAYYLSEDELIMVKADSIELETYQLPDDFIERIDNLAGQPLSTLREIPGAAHVIPDSDLKIDAAEIGYDYDAEVELLILKFLGPKRPFAHFISAKSEEIRTSD